MDRPARLTTGLLCLWLAAAVPPAAAQVVPPLFGGRVTVGNDVVLGFGGYDGRWFNSTDYYVGNYLRLATADMQIGVRASERLS